MNKIINLYSFAFCLTCIISCKSGSESNTKPNENQNMNTQELKNTKSAELLILARNENRLITLPDELRPTTIEEAYAIQDILIDKIGEKQHGWKIAVTNDQLMKEAQVNEPISGPLFERWIYTNHNIIKSGLPTLRGFEFEFAFKMKKDLPKKDKDYTEQEVKEAVESMHPAIEVVGSRYQSYPKGLDAKDLIADHCNNFSFVYGDSVPNWQNLNLANCKVKALFDNQEVAQNTGANVLGNPLNALTWLANHLIKRGHHLKAGDWITTGAAIGPLPKDPPTKVTADFGDLGKVYVEFDK